MNMVLFQYPQTTVCVHRANFWNYNTGAWDSDTIDSIYHMDEFPRELRKDLISRYVILHYLSPGLVELITN